MRERVEGDFDKKGRASGKDVRERVKMDKGFEEKARKKEIQRE